MRKSRFSETQIMGILRQAEGGLAVVDLCRVGAGAKVGQMSGGVVQSRGGVKPGHWLG